MNGKITIGLMNSNNPKFNNQFCIRIEDENYNLITEVIISPEKLSLAMAGQALTECVIISNPQGGK